jgi:alkanesulfonate monooxygenase SsuD/methylene tetrahydromethanopterin reductase-like flavin-dependent oxidoreductase (luciferase family)
VLDDATVVIVQPRSSTPHRPAPAAATSTVPHHRKEPDTMTLRHPDPRPNRALMFTPMEQRRDLIVDAAVLADQLGYDTVLIPEGWGFDAGVVLAEIALKTTRIRIATGITSIWGRSPATIAMMAATLDDVSGGRFTLGLGTSTPTLAEQFHDVAFHRPTARLAHTISQVRALLDGERTTPTGGGRGLRLGVPARPDLPIWIAALAPRATAIAMRGGDGWYPALVPLDRIDTLRATASAAAPGDPNLIAGPMVAAGDDGQRAAEQLVGWYLTGMGPLYPDFVGSLGYHDEVRAIRASNPRPAPGAVDWPRDADPLLEQLAAVGTRQAIAGQLAEWDERADIVAVCVGPDDPAAVLAAVETAAPPTRLARRSEATLVAASVEDDGCPPRSSNRVR